MKTIGCTFTMSGAYNVDEKSVYAARLKAVGEPQLPADQHYVCDSIIIDDIAECMITNGWSDDAVDSLSMLTPKTLITEIGRRCKLGIEEEEKFTTTRLKEFLLDYYGLDYDELEEKRNAKASSEGSQEKYTFLADPETLSKVLIDSLEREEGSSACRRYSPRLLFATGKENPDLCVLVSLVENVRNGLPVSYSITLFDDVTGSDPLFLSTNEASEAALKKALSELKEMVLRDSSV